MIDDTGAISPRVHRLAAELDSRLSFMRGGDDNLVDQRRWIQKLQAAQKEEPTVVAAATLGTGALPYSSLLLHAQWLQKHFEEEPQRYTRCNRSLCLAALSQG